jgi:hypothetical protein
MKLSDEEPGVTPRAPRTNLCGPPAELAGLTKDGVTAVQVVLDGTPHDAIFGQDAWYYRFPNNQTPATAATACRHPLGRVEGHCCDSNHRPTFARLGGFRVHERSRVHPDDALLRDV